MTTPNPAADPATIPDKLKPRAGKLSVFEQLVLHRAIANLDVSAVREAMRLLGQGWAQTATDDEILAIAHQARLNDTYCTNFQRTASETWLRSKGYPAPIFPGRGKR